MAEASNPFAAFANISLPFLEETLGNVFIAYILASVGFGFTFFQSYFYYTRYSKDHWLTQASVVVLCLLDTAMSCLASHMLYYYLVTLFALPVGPDQATSSFCIEVILSGLAIALVHIFYAVRIWQAGQNPILPALIIVLAIGGGAVGVASGVVMLNNPTFANFGETYMKAVIASGQGLRVLAGILATIGVVAHDARPATKESEKSVFWDPISFSLTSGTLGTLVEIVCLVVFAARPNKYLWIVFHFFASRVWFNGLLLMINGRPSLNGRGVYEDTQMSRAGTQVTSTRDLRFTNQRSMTNHAVNIEVSVKTDRDGDIKYDDRDDTHSLNGRKVDVNAF